MPTTLSVFLYLIAAALFLHRLYDLRTKGRRSTATFLIFLFLSSILFWYENANILVLISGVILLNAVITYYGTELCYAYITIAAVYGVLAYPIGANYIAQAFLMGLLSGSQLKKSKYRKPRKEIEVRRNLVQIVAGIVAIGVFYFLNYSSATAILLGVVLAGLSSATYADRNRLSNFGRAIYRIERKDIGLGVGAIWLALGSLIAVSFLPSKMILIVFAALFIGDSFSTIVGINYSKPKLFYNKNKSVSGTLAYFITTAIVAFPLIGVLGLVISLLAAFLESQPYHIDDNFDVSLILTALLLI